MPPLREIPFNYEVKNNRVVSMTYEGHEAVVVHNDAGALVKCTCQDDPWTHTLAETNEKILQTFNAHLSYATRPKTRPD